MFTVKAQRGKFRGNNISMQTPIISDTDSQLIGVCKIFGNPVSCLVMSLVFISFFLSLPINKNSKNEDKNNISSNEKYVLTVLTTIIYQSVTSPFEYWGGDAIPLSHNRTPLHKSSDK